MWMYLSFLSPMSVMSAQPVSASVWTRDFSSLSGERPLICLTVLSRATMATTSGFASFFAIALAWANMFSCPACK